VTEIEATVAPVAPRKKKEGRLSFLDWTRGLAATIMLQGHVFHSFARPDLRDSGPYIISQFIGGIAPAIFLFLTGVTLAFLMEGMERRGAHRGERVLASCKRAGYLAILAFGFRFQLWLFGYPYSSLADLLRVDILNCMALAILTMVGLAALTTAERVHAGTITGIGIAAAAPLVALIPEGTLPFLVHRYITPDPNTFAYFPWAAFVAFGIAAGSVLRLVPSDHLHRVMQWASILGFGLIISGQYFSNLPYSLYPSVDFWINSPGLIFIKLGVIFVIVALTFLWTHHGAGQGWSWVKQLGTTSLLVYWVHIELVYGRWFGSYKESLSLMNCTAGATLLIVAMIALSRFRTSAHWPAMRLGSVKAAN
jgi:uncharacterized membrane protein